MKKKLSAAHKNKPPRDRIIDTAMRLFYSQGIKATGVDTLIAQSGIAKMTFYKHFPSKHALVMEFLKRRDAEWLGWFHRRLEAGGKTGKDRLLAVFDVLGEWFSDPDFRGCAFINTVAETRDAKTEEHHCALAHKKSLALDLERIAREAGMADAKRISQELLLLIEGAIVSAQMQGSPQPARTAKAIAQRILEKRGDGN